MDFDAIFDGKTPAITPEPNPAEAPSPPAEAQAPAEAVAETAPEPQPEPTPAPQTPKDGPMAPVAALLDERDKRKAAEQRLAELEARLAQQQPQETPDPYDDPAGYQAHIASQVQVQALSLKFDLSESMAREKYGDDAVTAAMEWGAQKAQANAGFRDEFLAQKNPIDWVVRQQQRDSLLSAIGDDDVETFVRRRAAELGLLAATDAGAGNPSVPGQQQAPRPAPPPRSIASAASATGSHREVSTGPLAALDAVFKG